MASLGAKKDLFLRVAYLLILFFGSTLLASAAASAKNYTAPTAGNTYYVNANTGSDSNAGFSTSDAFRTLNHAVSKTNPGDTVLVMNGTYIEDGSSTATLRINRAGTADNWITYQAYPGHSPLIQSNGAWQAVRIESRYIIVDGFRVRGIRDQVSYAEAEQAFNDYRYNGVGMQPRIHGSGITLSPFNIVRNNEVWNFGGGGIEVRSIDSVIVENNLVYDTSQYSPFGHSGISSIYSENIDGTQVGLEGTKYKIIIRGNTSHSNENYFPCGCYDYRAVTDGNGIIVDDLGNYNSWTLVANNLVFNNGGSGIHTYLARNVDIINNTAYQNAQSEDIQGDLYSRRSENINLINNIIYAKSGEAVTTDNPGTNINYSYNIYYDGTNSPYIPGGLGTGDIIADPQFINPGLNPNNVDFRLSSSSPGINSGSSAYLPMNDIRGAARPQGATDRGAYENTSIATAPTPTPPVAPTPTPPVQPTPTPAPPVQPTPTPAPPTQPSSQPSSSQPIAPTGTITTDSPTYVWAKVDNATAYWLFGRNLETNQISIHQTYQSDEITCDSNQCTIASPRTLETGNYYWNVMAKNDFGDSSWSTKMYFSVTDSGSTETLSRAEPLSPNGTIAAGLPTFAWTKINGATAYRVFSRNVNTNQIMINETFPLSSGTCDSNQCRITSPNTFGAGSYYWVVLPSDERGEGSSWSERMDFSISGINAATANDDLDAVATETGQTIHLYLPLFE